MEDARMIYPSMKPENSETVPSTVPSQDKKMIYDRSLDKSADSTEYRKNYPGADETVFLAREADATMYPNTDPGRVSVRRSEAPFHIMESIYKASEKGNGDFLKTSAHWEGVLEGMKDEIEPKTMEQIRSFFTEGKNVKVEGREDFLKKVLDFVKTISYQEY